jgi:hypothetical protein
MPADPRNEHALLGLAGLEWIGNGALSGSQARRRNPLKVGALIAQRHYLQVTEGDFERATAGLAFRAVQYPQGDSNPCLSLERAMS